MTRLFKCVSKETKRQNKKFGRIKVAPWELCMGIKPKKKRRKQ